MNFWEKLLNIDRRWIFLLMAIVVIIPFFSKMGLPVVPSREVEDVFNHVDSLDKDDSVMIGFDFQPGTMAENQPMTVAVLRHCFSRNIPVFLTSYFPLGNGLAEEAVATLTDEDEPGNFVLVRWDEWSDYRTGTGMTRDELMAVWEQEHQLPDSALGWVFEGMDLCVLGYAPVFSIVLLGMGSSISAQYPTDLYGNDVTEMPILRRNKNAREIDLGFTVAGSSAVLVWLTYAHESYGMPIAFGVTAVMATDYYPYIQSGQIIGQLGGLRGAAEYEVLLKEHGYAETTAKAFQGMDVQSLAHLLIIAFVVLGNVAYFAGGFHQKRGHRLKVGR